MDWKRITRFFRPAKRKRSPSRSPLEGRWGGGSAGSVAGSRKYILWVPATHDAQVPSPLVMMLHGCNQKPGELAEISAMNAVAEKNNFLVVYPEQPSKANLLRCWNWFDRKHQSRGEGEPSVLAAIVEDIRSSYNIDPDCIYVAGISAGAAMAVVLGATYPDLFAGIGVMAGVAFKAATSLSSGLIAMKNGGPDPKQQGLLAFEAMSIGLRERPRGRMPVVVFQGDADPYINPINADQLIMQWATTNQSLNGNKKIDTDGELTKGSIAGGYSFEKYSYKDGANRLLMEKWVVEGLGHAWSGSPARGSYADPKGPNASQEMWRFFCETAKGAPQYPISLRSLWDRLARIWGPSDPP